MKEKLKIVKTKIQEDSDFTQEEKTQTVKRIDEWFLEDQAEGTIVAELTELSKRVVPILEEVGLL